MTEQELKTAKKIARILRAARKKRALTQIHVAQKLGISQGALSKMESGLLIPSVVQWFDFCQTTEIPVDAYSTGYIDGPHPAMLREGRYEGSFILPRKYSHARGSTARGIQPFLGLLADKHGEDALRDYLREKKVDPDFFVAMDHQIGVSFLMDLARDLIQRGDLRQDNLSALVAAATAPEAQGNLQFLYGQSADQRQLLTTLVQKAAFYECNSFYAVEDDSARELVVSIRPGLHLRKTAYGSDPTLGDFFCQYKKKFMESFAVYRGLGAKPSSGVQEVDCHFKGAPKCVYRIAHGT